LRTIAHISDVHFGTIDDRAIVDALLQDVNNRQPALVVLSGDLTQRARAWQYKAAAAMIARLAAPKLVVPGNHDIPLYDVISRFAAPLGNYTRYITNDLRPEFEDDELSVVGVNTARPFSFSWNGFWKDGKISDEQLLDVRRRMRERPESGRMKVVVTHHPFIPPPGERLHGIVHNAARALTVLEECGVDVLLAGHLHMGYSGDVRTHHEATKRSMLSIQAGTATSSRLRGGERNAYNWLTIEPDMVTIESRVWDESKFGTGKLTRFQRVDQIWRCDEHAEQ
jgi:3',5'-cyclic AMP phosphodiesterase CpdA